MIHALCIAIACCLPQDESEEVTLEQELEALIAKTNALESLHLIFDVESSADGENREASWEFVYQAPDLGHARMSGDLELDFWLVGGHVYQHADDVWRVAVLEDPPVNAVLYELFPRKEQPLPPGVNLPMSVAQGLQLSFRRFQGGRPYLLGWLADLRSRSDVVRSDESFVWEEDGVRCKISRATGLLEEVAIDSPKDGHFRLRLRSWETDVELATELVTPPEEALAAPHDSGFARSLRLAPPMLRQQAFLHVEDRLTNGTRDFDARARKDWRSVMDALHRETMLLSYTEWIAQLQAVTTRRAEWVRKQLVADPSPERRAELEKTVAEGRAKNEKVIETTRERYETSLPKVESEVLEPRAELYEVEEEAVAALWEELVSGAVLTRYDEEMARALEN